MKKNTTRALSAIKEREWEDDYGCRKLFYVKKETRNGINYLRFKIERSTWKFI